MTGYFGLLNDKVFKKDVGNQERFLVTGKPRLSLEREDLGRRSLVLIQLGWV